MQSGHPGWHEGITDFTSKCGYLIADIKQMPSADNLTASDYMLPSMLMSLIYFSKFGDKSFI